MRGPGLTLALAALVAGGMAAPQHVSHAETDPRHDRLVSHVPSGRTPDIADGRVHAIADLGRTVVVGGSFTKVASHGSSALLDRPYLFAFDKATGQVDPEFAPRLNRVVHALLAGPFTDSVYVGGSFTAVNGARRRALVLLSVPSGAQITSFAPPVINGPVRDLAAHPNGALLVGGTFTQIGTAARGGLASLGGRTGRLNDYLAVALAEHHNFNGAGAEAAVGARELALSPDSQRLAVIGNFRTADGQDRDQIVMISTGSASAMVSSWQTDSFTSACNQRSFDSWVRDVEWSPDGSYFVVASAGSIFPGTLCDTASAWSGTETGADRTPIWVAASGGDSLLSVAITEQAVYIGGHIRWVNNPTGTDSARPGAIGRASIAALDPANGLPYAWNPGRNPRGFGVTELLATSEGLWLGYDTDYLGNVQYRRERIGFFPLAGGATVPPGQGGELPGSIYLAGAEGAGDIRVREYHEPGEVGQSTPLASSGGVDWQDVRGAFWADEELFYGMSDGRLYRQSFESASGSPRWGAPQLVDPYHDTDGERPDWDEVSHGPDGTYEGSYPDFYGTELASVTGMFFADGRIYYTLANSAAIYWRWFTPSSGAVGAQRSTLVGSGFGDVAGALFAVDGQLYVSRSDGALHRMSFAGGTPSGTPQVVSGPDVDGLFWRARAIFPGP